MLKNNHKYKIIIIFILSVVIFSALIFGVANYLNSKINTVVHDLAGKLTAKVGQTVTIESVTTQWHWLNLKVNIKNLVVLDNNSNTPMFMVNNIVSTVDVLKSILTMDIKFKRLLLLSPRMIIQWDGLNPPSVIGLAGDPVAGKINIPEFLQLIAMQHSVVIENGDFHIQGLNQADIPLMNVRLDFQEKANMEYMVLLRGSVAAAVPPEFNAAMHYTGSLEDPNNFRLNFEINTSNLQVDSLLNLLPKYKQNFIQGAFANLDIKGAVQNGILRSISTEFEIDELHVGSEVIIAGGKGIVAFNPLEEHCHLTAQNFNLHDKLQPKHVVKIDSLSGDVKIVQAQDIFELTSDNLKLKILNMESNSKVVALIKDDKLLDLKFDADFQNAKVNEVLKILPSRLLGDNVSDWLRKSLVAGSVINSEILYKGETVYFTTAVQQAELKYSQEWPSIKSIDATVVLNDKGLRINTSAAKILDTPINSVTTNFVTHNGKPYGLILISGNIESNLETGLSFLKQSPLKSKIADKLAGFNPNGNMLLDLKLEVDLVAPETTVVVRGAVSIANGIINIPDTKIPINEIFGNLYFTNKTLLSKDLRLSFFKHPAKASITLDPKVSDSLQIKLDSLVDANDIKQNFANASLDFLNGSSNITALIDIPLNAKDSEQVISISSNLHGMALDLPAPFNKSSANKVPMQLKLYLQSKNQRTINIKWSDWFDANLFVVNNQLNGGHIAVNAGKASLSNPKTLFISGKIPTLDWDVWDVWLQKRKGTTVLPIKLDILINDLKFHGKKYNAMLIKYDSETNIFKLDSPLITGSINISKDKDRVDVRLEKLDLSDYKASATTTGENELIKAIKAKNKQKQLPIIQFYCENLSVAKQKYRKVSLHLLPRTYGYEIVDLSVSNDNILVQAQGQWQMENKESTLISGNAYTKNLGVVVQDINFGKSISKGHGELNFALQWSGDPTQVALPKLDGNLHIELQNGILTGINPGIGRIIGLLSLESIQRRLKLDFSDLNSKGLAFDTLSSDLNLKSGVLSTKKMAINCPSVRIELYGNSDLNTHALDLNMYVSPKVGVGLPVAAAIAIGNPIAGAAVWLLDQASGSKISEMTRYKYQVSGTWEAPKIVDISSEINNKTAPDTK